MATRDPVLEELMRNGGREEASLKKSPLGASFTTTQSLEVKSASEEIDGIVNKKWHIEELLGPIRSKLAILSGGRDKRGAPIITMHPTDHSDISPTNIGRILSYLSKIPHSTIQGLGCTIILDSSKTNWTVTKSTLKSLQLTFVEHIHQALVLRPKSFWNRQRALGLTMKKVKYNFSTHVLESASDLQIYLDASQLTQDLGGTLVYHHDNWVETQRNLEKHTLSLQGRMEDYYLIQDQLEEKEDPQNLDDARDAVRRHVEAKQQLEKADLDTACEAVSHTVSKLLPCENPDFLACFAYLEELCSRLQDIRNQLERVWDEKGAKLDRILQLRLFEGEAEKLRQWVDREVGQLAQEHTDIGDSVSAAQQRKASFGEYRTRLKAKHEELCHTVGMGKRLISAQHFASEKIKELSEELEAKWERLKGVVEGRVELFDLSLSFHQNQHEFFQQVEVWQDECQSKDIPPDIPTAEEALAHHDQLKETCQSLYVSVRTECHKIVEKLRIPVGDSSLPKGFVMGTRHVKEILESLVDEKNWIDEQWALRRLVLFQTLNLRKFQQEAKKVHAWVSDTGNPFLTVSNTLGSGEQDALSLLQKHAAFDTSTEETCEMTEQLLSQADSLSASKDCDPAAMKLEVEGLHSSMDRFVSRMGERKEILEQAVEAFRKISELEAALQLLSATIPQDQFNGPSNIIESRLQEFQSQWTHAKQLSSSTHEHCQVLIERLQASTESARKVDTVVDYTGAERELEARGDGLRALEERVWSGCERRERRWNLTIHLNQFEPDVEKHILRLESWIQDQDSQELECAQNPTDAKLELDNFQQRCDQISKSHSDLVVRGRSVAWEIEESDRYMFSGGEKGRGPHAAVTRVEGIVERMVRAHERMVGVTGPRLQRLSECYQYHYLKQRSTKLLSSLTSLSGTVVQMKGVGQTQEETNTLHSKVTDVQYTVEDIAKQVSEIEKEISTHTSSTPSHAEELSEMAKLLRERCASLEKHVADKIMVVSASLDFHNNMKNLNSTMDEYEAEFSSKEVGHTLSNTRDLLKSLTGKKTFITQATEVVKSQGKKLQDILTQSQSLRSIYGGSSIDLSQLGKDEESGFVSSAVRRVQSSEDILDSIEDLQKARSSSMVTETPKAHMTIEWEGGPRHTKQQSLDIPTNKTKSWDLLDVREDTSNMHRHTPPLSPGKSSPLSPASPKRVLFIPKRTRAATGLKPAVSMPSLVVNQNQQLVQGFLIQIDTRLKKLILLWEGRKKGLEEAQKAVEFREAVPAILEWIDTTGNDFLKKYDHYGRSKREVRNLLKGCNEFEQTEMVEMSEKVRKLLGSYRALKGHIGVPDIRTHHNTLQSRWEGFEKEVRKLTANMELALKFHAVLYESSAWCQGSQRLLNEMDEKALEITKSEQASSLTAEVTAYLTATWDQQEARIDQLNHISSFLVDSQLTGLANQVTQSTKQTERDLDSCKTDLEALCRKFLEQESEKDRAKKLAKKRVLVMEELLQTEEAYVKDLRLIVERFRPRFVSDLLPNTLKGKEKIIFGNVHEIEAFHRTFLLPRLQDHKGIVDDIANLFVERVEEMISIYVPFCQGKTASEELLASHRTYLARVQSLFGIETPLSTLMIKPIQRITKYPLLFKDALKLTKNLGQSTKALEGAVEAVEKVLIATNNAIHICLLENSKDLISDLGELIYQGSLLVSEPRFGIKTEKERHIFCFDRALLFTRKVELPQTQTANFKYEYKFKIPITTKVQVLEFVEGEPTHFFLVAGDNRLHFKAPALDEKQRWVKSLRTAILSMNPQTTPIKADRNITKGLLEPEALVVTDSVASPTGSPFLRRKEMNGNGDISVLSSSPQPSYAPSTRDSIIGFDKYIVKEDYRPPPSSEDTLLLPLNQGDIVEILDNSINGKWFVRAQSGAGGVTHGWFPSALLERVDRGEGEEEVDGKKGWVQITAGPLSGGSDEEKLRRLEKDKKAFGSHDLQSQKVISNLKKVTIALEGGGGGGGGGEGMENGGGGGGGEGSSLDFSSLDKHNRPPLRQIRANTLPQFGTSPEPHGTPEAPGTPTNLEGGYNSATGSPWSSPHHARRYTEAEITDLVLSNSGNFKRDQKKSQFTRKKNVVKMRSTRKGPRRQESVGSNHSEGGASQEGDLEGEMLGEHRPLDKSVSSSSEDALQDKPEEEPRPPSENSSEHSETSTPAVLSPEKIKKTQEKLKYIMAELIDTEKTYVSKLEDCIKGYMPEMQSPNLPDTLKGKEKIIFGNIKALCAFHKDVFLDALVGAKDSVDATAKCFIDHLHDFELYMTYCENKPKSESFLWTYMHTGGTFFEDIQKQLGHRQGINSFLIQPVQRISRYKLLVRDIHAAAKKLSLVTPILEKAVQVTEEVPKKANDAMTLSMIYGYEGNIHKHGQIILQDEFTVFERHRRTSVRRQLFLLDQRLIITKEKDADGLYVFKDALKVHSLSVAEKEGDNPNRFAVGTGTVGAWDQYYLLEAGSPEVKQKWLQALKDIMKGQYELLKALSSASTSRPRSKTFDAPSVSPIPIESVNDVGMITDSEEEGDEFEPPPLSAGPVGVTKPRSNTAFAALPSSPYTPTTPYTPTGGGSGGAEVFTGFNGRTASVAEPTPSTPTIAPRTLNLYIVAEDCAPPKEGEGIMYIYKGQIYDIIDSSSDWWLARLVRDVMPNKHSFCEQGWVPGSFLDRYEGHLGKTEEALVQAEYQRKNLKRPAAVGQSSSAAASFLNNALPGSSNTMPVENKKKKKKRKSEGKRVRLHVTSSLSFQAEDEEFRDMLARTTPRTSSKEDMLDTSSVGPKAPVLRTPLSNETVIAGRSVTFRCQLEGEPHPPPSVDWSHNGALLTIDRAFSSFSDNRAVLRINEVEVGDDGDYTCTIANSEGVVSSTAMLCVISTPSPPTQLSVKMLSSTAVKLCWAPPTFIGHSNIVHYLVECKDTTTDRWSCMKQVPDTSTDVTDLMSGTEYVFRVYARNLIGQSEASEESEGVRLCKRTPVTEFSLEPFEGHYDLLDEIGRGQFGAVHDCLHKTTQQLYAAKLLPLEVGRDHAQHELEMLSALDHPHIVLMTSGYLTQHAFILVFQKVTGPNVLEYFVLHDNLTEYLCAGVVEQLLQALQYLHQQQIAHFSIRPENLLTFEVAEQPFPSLKLCHFERAQKLEADSNYVLSPLEDHIEYEAPEILLEQPVTVAADMWSLGAVVFTILGGSSPFCMDSLDLTKDNITSSRYSFPLRTFKSVSQSAKDFISSLLLKDRSKRLSSEQALNHTWLNEALDPTNADSAKLSVERLRQHVEQQHWKYSSQL